MSYNTSKSYSSGPSLGNLERVRSQSLATPSVETYNYATASLPDAPDHVYAPSSSSAAGNVIGHDLAGRVSSKSVTAEAFQYDPLGRLTQVTRNSVASDVLRYDPMGSVVGRLSSSTITYYVGGLATATASAPGACSAPGCTVDPAMVKVDVHVVVGLRRIASVRVLTQSTARVLYLHRNRLGNIVATSVGGGLNGASYAWGVHGDLAVPPNETVDTASEIGFTGSLRLTGGLLLMGRRVYDPSLRQFLQPDVIDPMTYSYAGGDPVNFVDPSGMIPVSVDRRDDLTRTPRPRSDYWFGCSGTKSYDGGGTVTCARQFGGPEDYRQDPRKNDGQFSAGGVVILPTGRDIIITGELWEEGEFWTRSTDPPGATHAEAAVLTITVGPSALGITTGIDVGTGFAVGFDLDHGFSFEWISEINVRAGVGLYAGLGVVGALYPTMPTATDVLGPQQGFGGDLGIWTVQKLESGRGPYPGGAIGVGWGWLFDLYWFRGETIRTRDIPPFPSQPPGH